MYVYASVYQISVHSERWGVGGIQTFNINVHVKCQCPPQAEVYVGEMAPGQILHVQHVTHATCVLKAQFLY